MRSRERRGEERSGDEMGDIWREIRRCEGRYRERGGEIV